MKTRENESAFSELQHGRKILTSERKENEQNFCWVFPYKYQNTSIWNKIKESIFFLFFSLFHRRHFHHAPKTVFDRTATNIQSAFPSKITVYSSNIIPSDYNYFKVKVTIRFPDQNNHWKFQVAPNRILDLLEINLVTRLSSVFP